MKAMILRKVTKLDENRFPLDLVDVPIPKPKPGEVLIRVSVCGICHTEIDEIEGRTTPPKFPIILGHQVIGRIENTDLTTSRFQSGDRVGVAWIFSACGRCKFCKSGNENLCDHFLASGRDVNGGYAEYMTASEKYIHAIPEIFSDAEAAPLLCAGAIGYRSMRLTGLRDGQNFGLTGFGASAHLVLKMVRYKYPNTRIFVFARSEKERRFAKELGAVWTGDSSDRSPEKLDSIIDTTPVWKPMVEALVNLEKGGRLVINAIRKEDVDKSYLEHLKYPEHLWLEKEIKSVANITSKDVEEFLSLASMIPLRPEIQEYPLQEANCALLEMKEQKIRGAKVLKLN